jgi:hypothetical protein
MLVMADDREERIRALAYELWVAAGRPEGGADEFWYEAERRLKTEDRAGLGEAELPRETRAPARAAMGR